jgi:hypothetical protein
MSHEHPTVEKIPTHACHYNIIILISWFTRSKAPESSPSLAKIPFSAIIIVACAGGYVFFAYSVATSERKRDPSTNDSLSNYQMHNFDMIDSY